MRFAASYPSILRDAIPDGEDHPDGMEILSVRRATRFDGWTVTVTKVRKRWRKDLEDAGYTIGTAYPKGRKMSVKVRNGGSA